MRRFSLKVLATVSLTALIAAGAMLQPVSAQAAASLGTLKQKGQWQIGTVETQGVPYCAMVSRYDRDTVLAFARNPDGFGSFAIEFSDAYFKSGAEYDVDLAFDGGLKKTYTGLATNTRSIVLQIGQGADIYDAFAHNGSLTVKTPVVEASYALSGFSGGYKNLQTCAAGLPGAVVAQKDGDAPAMDAVRPPEVERAADEGVSAVTASAENTRVAQAEGSVAAPVAPASAAKTSSNPFSGIAHFFGFGGKKETAAAAANTAALETSLAGDASAQAEKAAGNIEKYDAQQASLKSEIAGKQDEIASIEQEKKTVERKLLASIGNNGDASAADVPNTTGKTAQQMEAQIISSADTVGGKEQQIAVLQAEQARALQQQKDTAAREQQALADKAAALQKQRDALQQKMAAAAPAPAPVKPAAAAGVQQPLSLAPAVGLSATTGMTVSGGTSVPAAASVAVAADTAASSAADRAQRASLIAKQAQIANVNAQRTAQAQAADSRMAATEAGYAQKIQALEDERDSLKRQLDQALAFNTTTKPVVDTRADDLQKKLDASEAARTESDKRALTLEQQNSALQAALDGQKKAMAAAAEAAQAKTGAADITLVEQQKALTAQLAQRQAEVTQLQARVKEMEAARNDEAARLAALQTERDAALQQVATLKDSLAQSQARVALLEKQTAQQPASADNAALKDAQAEIAKLRDEKSALEQKIAGMQPAQKAPVVAVAAAPVAAVSAAKPVPAAPAPATAAKSTVPEGYVRWDGAAAPDAVAAPVTPVVKEPVTASVKPAVTAAKAPVVAAQAAPVAASPADTSQQANNRAAAFLEKLMSDHPATSRPAAVDAPLPVPAAAKAAKRAAVLPIGSTDVLPSKPTPAPAVAQMPARKKLTPQAPLTLEAMLDEAGIGNADLRPAQAEGNGIVRQWQAGNISGMYERQTGVNLPFSAAADSYLQRYKADCPDHLQVNVGPVKTGAAGAYAAGDMVCTQPGNNYRTSFVMMQSGAQFTVVLHSGHMADEAQVSDIGQRVLSVVASSGGIIPPVAEKGHAIEVPARRTAPAQDAGAPKTSTIRDGAGNETLVIE